MVVRVVDHHAALCGWHVPRYAFLGVTRWSDDGQMSKKKQPDPLAAVTARRAEGASIHVPEGWVPLMTELHAALVEASPDFEYAEVKQKWGELRVYVSGATPEAHDLIAAAELRSRSICEVCGGVGSACRSSHGWYRALCGEHAAELRYTVVEPR